jgi:[ribosomal protein S5]-alanine N-acetyltransferase
MLISLGGARLRSYLPQDAPLLARYANDARVTAYMRDGAPREYTVDEAAAWIELVRAQTPECQFSIEIDGAIVGGIGLELQPDVYAHSAELSYWIAEPYWGRGVATRAVAALTDHAFWQLRLTRLYARVFEGNTASIRVLEKCAYELEGRLRRAAYKDGRYVDQRLYAKLRAPH